MNAKNSDWRKGLPPSHLQTATGQGQSLNFSKETLMPFPSARPEQNIGSQWYRWEPHIHAPGTILNDQFTGADQWEKYLSAIESASPPIRALGVTDYYSTETYEQVCDAKSKGRLPGCHLIFPNIEMRLGVGTVRGRQVNIHLLVSPEDPNHLAELKRFLERLSFKAHDDSYSCKKDDLIRLGHISKAEIKDSRVALEHGSIQFKVTFEDLKKAYSESKWSQQNILIAVAGSATDGTSGVRDPADTTLRQEIEKFAQVIFASSPQQREFWLGRGNVSEAEMAVKYGGPKPCMHGSDAHELGKVGVPDGDRFSWIKGDPQFDTLRQACIDPSGRCSVGPEPPLAAPSSQTVASVEIKGAPWATTPVLALNPGLVAIIGARGSGKTALADMLALGCDAIPDSPSPGSFLTRAQSLLSGAIIGLRWQEGEEIQRNLDRSDRNGSDCSSRARYLSQQFVEELCSADEVTDALMGEMERVIFNSHPLADRDGAVDFAELLETRVTRFRMSREMEEEGLADISERIGTDLEKKSIVDSLKRQVIEKNRIITGYKKDRAKLVTKGSEERVARLANLTTAAETVRGYLRFFHTQEQSLLALQDEVANLRTHKAPESLRQAKEKYKASQLKPEEWDPFLLDYSGDVDATINQQLDKVRELSKAWKGTSPAPLADPNSPYIVNDALLEKQPLATIQAEIARIESLINVDRNTATKFSALSRRVDEENAALQKIQEKLEDCTGASERIKALVSERESSYNRVFKTIQAEQEVLSQLYNPLMARLEKAGGTLKKLSFSVSRQVNVDAWADAGEALLDLRQKGPFKGKGTLQQLAAATLKSPWETGDANAVSDAMTKFRAENQEALLEKSIVPKDDPEYRTWSKRFAKWLYGTDHITVHYSIDYDGVDIRKLSPGTRGIVLLLLYLALDDEDDRPLIIDQPEENLDPKSIFDELVPLFLEAKGKRQVIMVTHNANLVVNTDADQIIIAEAGPHRQGELPPITYTSGGLENVAIRKAVCDILEGGERAFQERARRLRVHLSR